MFFYFPVEMTDFQLTKYLGKWYELLHYPSWFQRNDQYNTTAEYTLNPDGTVAVHNRTISQGKEFATRGTARNLGGTNFRVDFPMPEVSKLARSGQFNLGQMNIDTIQSYMDSDQANYVIDKLWTNQDGDYVFAIVTDPRKQSLYVLSRFAHPSLTAYNHIMEYVVANYDRDRLVQTPHFDQNFY